MASGPITSWEIDGETVQTVSDFIFLGSKITADGDCSHEIKRHLLLERKIMNNLDSILKSRAVTLSTSPSSQGYDFSSGHVWMWEFDYKESWGGQSIGVSALASFLPKNTQGWSPLEWTGWISLQSKGLSRVFSNITVQKHQFFSAQPSSQSNSHIHTWPQEKP